MYRRSNAYGKKLGLMSVLGLVGLASYVSHSQIPPPLVQQGVIAHQRLYRNVLRSFPKRASSVVARGWAGKIERSPHEIDVTSSGEIAKFHPGTEIALRLGNKGIRSLPPSIFESAETVASMSLDSNTISELQQDVFKGLDNLKDLTLSGNILSTINPGAFNGLTNLQSLTLAKNPIKQLPVGVFDGLVNLTSLTIHSVPLETIEPEVFTPLSNLKVLHMYNTEIKSLSSEFFKQMPNLRVLSIHMAKVTDFPSDFLEAFPNLEELSIDGESLPLGSNPKLFTSQTRLKHVYLFGKTNEEIFKQVRSALADANNCKVIVADNPNMGPGYRFT